MDQINTTYEKRLLDMGYIIQENGDIGDIDVMYSVDTTPVQYVMYKKRLLEMGYTVKEESITDDGDIVINMTVQKPDHSFLSPDEVESCLYPILNDEYPKDENSILQVIQLAKRTVTENKDGVE